MGELQPYTPDLERIARQHEDPQPLILEDYEYGQLLAEYGLYRGAEMSDVDILKAMEAGLIKIWDKEAEPGFNLLEQVQSASVDLRIGHHYWWIERSRLTQLILGNHIPALRDLQDTFKYAYQVTGDMFTYHAHGDLILAVTQETVSLSNCVIGYFDGRSTAARLGLSVHQTAGRIEPGFGGELITELSNVSFLPVLVRTGNRIGSLSFKLVGNPSSRPRNISREGKSVEHMQSSPFGFIKQEWAQIRKLAIERNLTDLEQTIEYIKRD